MPQITCYFCRRGLTAPSEEILRMGWTDVEPRYDHSPDDYLGVCPASDCQVRVDSPIPAANTSVIIA